MKGKGGDNLRNICTVTGAQVLPRGNKLFELKGTEKEVQHAELLMKRRVVCTLINLFCIRNCYTLVTEQLCKYGSSAKQQTVKTLLTPEALEFHGYCVQHL